MLAAVSVIAVLYAIALAPTVPADVDDLEAMFDRTPAERAAAFARQASEQADESERQALAWLEREAADEDTLEAVFDRAIAAPDMRSLDRIERVEALERKAVDRAAEAERKALRAWDYVATYERSSLAQAPASDAGVVLASVYEGNAIDARYKARHWAAAAVAYGWAADEWAAAARGDDGAYDRAAMFEWAADEWAAAPKWSRYEQLANERVAEQAAAWSTAAIAYGQEAVEWAAAVDDHKTAVVVGGGAAAEAADAAAYEHEQAAEFYGQQADMMLEEPP